MRWVDHFRHRHDPLTSLVLTVPVFVFYHLGVLFIDRRNGVDWVTGLTLRLLDRSIWGYVGVTVGYGLGMLAVGAFLRGRAAVHPSALGPVLLESLFWGLCMMATVGWTTRHLFASDIQAMAAQAGGSVASARMGPFTEAVMAAGAGFHEELFFRAGLFAGGAFLLRRLVGLGEGKAALIAAVVSSALFSGAHYVGALGAPFTLVSFTFRFLAGLFLAAIYRYRGFAVGVYTHTLYDLLVFFVI